MFRIFLKKVPVFHQGRTFVAVQIGKIVDTFVGEGKGLVMFRKVAVGFLFFLAGRSIADADGNISRRKNTPLEIEIVLWDTHIFGAESLKKNNITGEADYFGGREKKPYSYLWYIWTKENYLQIQPNNFNPRNWEKKVVDVNGWYMTADYSTNPPQLIATPRPTKNSMWTFVHKEREAFYIKAETDAGKQFWITTEKTGKPYKLDEKTTLIFKREILSEREKEAFYINDVKKDGGK